MTITEFLTARLDEDEADPSCEGADEYVSCSRWSSRRLAEVEAKRRIVERETAPRTMHRDLPWYSTAYRGNDRGGVELLDERGNVLASGTEADALILEHSDPVTDTPILRLLALPFADHPDYDEAWRP